jgi:hypothetical protein
MKHQFPARRPSTREPEAMTALARSEDYAVRISLQGKDLGTIALAGWARMENWLPLIGQILSLLCGKV